MSSRDLAIHCRKFSAAESEQPGIESDHRSLQALWYPSSEKLTAVARAALPFCAS
eukprot:COSAG01_NODE_591_length_15119_cov_19.340879_7_plen_55_part_00